MTTRSCAQCGGEHAVRDPGGHSHGSAGLPPPGTVPGDQGGEPRRPQVGDRFEHYEGDPLGFVTLVAVSAPTATCFDNDCRMRWDDGSEQDYHTSFLLGEYGSAWRPAPQATRGVPLLDLLPICPRCDRYTMSADAGGWRCRKCGCHVPATQGAAVAGPAGECPCCTDETIPADADCTCPSWCHEQQETRPGHRTAPPPPASEPPGCNRHCACAITAHGALAEATAAKAALEVQMAEARSERDVFKGRHGELAIEATTAEDAAQEWSGKFFDMRAERDALAAQLADLAESVSYHHEITHGGAFAQCPFGHCVRARAALAASGPVKEGTS